MWVEGWVRGKERVYVRGGEEGEGYEGRGGGVKGGEGRGGGKGGKGGRGWEVGVSSPIPHTHHPHTPGPGGGYDSGISGEEGDG